MHIETHVEALTADLEQIAAAGDEATSRAARLLSAAIRASATLRVLGAINEAAQEISAQLPSGRVDVRFGDGEATLVYADAPSGAAVPATEEGDTARISLRLPENLKAAIEESALQEGLSVNSWLVRVLAKATATRGRRGPGSRLTGYARS